MDEHRGFKGSAISGEVRNAIAEQEALGSPGARANSGEGAESAVVRARHGWLYWLELSFLVIISSGCIWAAAMLALFPTGPTVVGYRIVLWIALPFALLHLVFVVVLRPDRIVEVTEGGVRVYRGRTLKTSLTWSEVKELRHGYLTRGSRYHGRVQRGYRVQLIPKTSDANVSVDSVRYDLATQELISFATKISTIAQLHAVPVNRGAPSSETVGR